MSYSISVTVKDGTATATTSGEVPAGEFTISGHDGPDRRDLGVTQRGPDGRYVATVGHSHYKDGG